mgnify:FL=1
MFASVIVDIQNSEVDKVFDYLVPLSLDLKAGDRVKVPFGGRLIEGFVVGLKEQSDVPAEKIKEVFCKLDSFSAITPEMLALMDYMRDEFFLKMVDVLKLFIPSGMRGGKVKSIIKDWCFISKDKDIEEIKNSLKKNAKSQLELVEYLWERDGEFSSVLAEKFSYSALSKLKEAKIVEVLGVETKRTPKALAVRDTKIKYTPEQENAIKSVDLSGSDTYLIHGVTGSGKTEVYMALIQKVLAAGKTAIMLVPEISLTPQVFSIFKGRFGDDVAILHSGLSAGERYDEWKRLLMGEAKIAIGARSAIFAPLKNLGVIIIDEEHDSSYISDSNPRYTTEVVAAFRAKYNHCPLILGSATPALTTYNRAKSGEIKLLELPVRVNGKELPKIQIVDMLSEVRDGGNLMFSSSLIAALDECISNKKQAMLFLNRRGYSSFMMCKECGYVARCTDCDVSLVYHKEDETLKCHYCGKRYKALTCCPECKSTYIKQGAIGTERIVAELKKYYPDVKILRMDNDTTSTKDSYAKILSEFSSVKPSILVGTQMIAKGHDFPDVTLVGIVDADQSLYHSDFRSAEKTFDLITQVSGRAGRSADEGKIILQTYCPRHYVYKFAANYNYKAFYEKEINIRETTGFPPFSVILRVLLVSEDDELVRCLTKDCYHDILEVREKYGKEFLYLDVMKAPLNKIMKKHRYQILMRFKPDHQKEITKEIFDIANKYKKQKVSVFVETNPQNLN